MRARELAWMVIALALGASACGARWSDEQRAAITARGRSAVDQQVRAGNPGTDGSTKGEAVGGDAAPTAEGTTDAAAPTAAGDAPATVPTTAAAPASTPCAAPSNAPGVTAQEIVVGSISSLSGPVPGLGASGAAATRAYVAYRNASGGVCGRKIVLRAADDGTDNGRYRSLVTQMSDQVFGIVGGFAIGDVGAIDVLEQRKIPLVGLPSADSVTEVSTVFDVNPIYANLDAVVGKYRVLRERGASKAAVVYLAVDQSRAEANKQQRLMKAAGITIVDVQELPVSTLSYDPAARRVANRGANYLFFIGDANANASMARSMADTGHKLAAAEYFSFAYGSKFIEQAGPAAEGATAWLRTLPNEEGNSNPEMARFLEWMGRIAPRDVRDTFAADAWAATKAFFDSLQALPGAISREAFVAQLRATENYDAGGMLGTIRFGAKLSNACVIGMRVEAGKWKRFAPASGFLC